MTTRIFTQKDLYGETGHPTPDDIAQDKIGDCYLISAMGSLAFHQPERIERAIRFRAETSSFEVTLYQSERGIFGTKKNAKAVQVEVTQSDIQADINEGGSSKNRPHLGQSGPAWPAVMEAAYAKHAMQPGDSVKTGFERIGNGGWPADAMFTLTGDHGIGIRASATSRSQQAKTADQLERAIADHRPVVLSTNPVREAVRDGLVRNDRGGGHAYMVEGLSREPSGEVHLSLRNPWGHNVSPSYGVDKKSAVVDAELNTISRNGHLQRIDIGPHPVKPVEEPIDRRAPKSPQSSLSTGDRYMDDLLRSLDSPHETTRSLQQLAGSLDALNFRELGQAEYMLEETRQQHAELTAQMQQESMAQAPVISGPVMRMRGP